LLCSDVRAYLLAPNGAAPADLATHLATCAACAALASASSRLDSVLQRAVTVDPPAGVQIMLASLVPAAGWRAQLGHAWRRAMARPWVLAGQVAAVAVLVYAVSQLLVWLGSSTLVLGDVPYAIELLVLSPALDYVSQLQALLQQLGLWLIVAAVGWIVAQGLPWQARQTAA
jgi:hypothetical protein